jgi:thiol-disulfide isomerase/thioredoxin
MIGALAASAAALPAAAQTAPEWLTTIRAMPGFQSWTPPTRTAERLLAASIKTSTGALINVRDWLAGRPTVVDVWATWCPPCLREKRAQAALSLYLERAGARAQIKGLHAFDSASLVQARAQLDRLGAQSLDTVAATVRAEQALLYIFGFDRDRSSTNRTSNMISELSTSLPFALLIAPDGTLVGQMVGAVEDDDGKSYWVLPETVAMLRALEAAPSS